MAKSKAYWEGRTEQLFNAQDKRNATTMNRLGKEYDRTASAIDKDIASYYTKYGKDDVIEYRKLVKRLNKSERDLLYQNYDAFVDKYPQHARLMPVRESIYKLNRLEGLQLSTRQNMLELGAIEQVEFDKALKTAYGNGYLSTMRGLQNSEAFFSVQDEILEQTLNNRWINGENFSDRIWGNKEKLINTLNTEVRDAFIRQDSYAKMKSILQHRAGVGQYDARRLIETEASFIMNQANGQAFQDDGIKRYENSAVLDGDTSEICKAMDGQKFLFTEARVSENYPPYHSFCRTIIIPVENR